MRLGKSYAKNQNKNYVGTCVTEVRENQHCDQHEGVGDGGLKHVDNTSGKVISQDERGYSPLSRDGDWPGSIR